MSEEHRDAFAQLHNIKDVQLRNFSSQSGEGGMIQLKGNEDNIIENESG